MHQRDIFNLGLTIGLMVASAYIGYLWGTHRMALAYGEAMSAEAIMYLVAKEQEGEG